MKKDKYEQQVVLSEQAYMFAHIPALIASLLYTRSVWVPLLGSLLQLDPVVIKPIIFILITTTLSVIGYLLHKKFPLSVPLWIGFSLSAITAIWISSMPADHSVYSWSYRDACIIGLVQAGVVLPGLTRLGCVTLAGCLLGYSPIASYMLAWLVHLPLMLGGVLLALGGMTRLSVKVSTVIDAFAYLALIVVSFLLLCGTDFLLRVDKYWYFVCYLCIPIGVGWYKDRENV
jgi:undecaprenyl pyrophosphate phosphatase UppP